MAGFELPEYLGKVKGQKGKQEKESIESQSPAKKDKTKSPDEK